MDESGINLLLCDAVFMASSEACKLIFNTNAISIFRFLILSDAQKNQSLNYTGR